MEQINLRQQLQTAMTSKLALPAIVIAAMLVGSGVAYTFFQSSAIGGEITVSSIFTAMINAENPEALIWVPSTPTLSGHWDYSAVTTSSSFSEGNVMNLMVDNADNNIQSTLVLMQIQPSGEYLAVGGNLGLSIQKKCINWEILVEDPELVDITNVGAPVVIENLAEYWDIGFQTELSDLAKDSILASPYDHYYYEMTIFQGDGGANPLYGTHTFAIEIMLEDGA